MPDTTHDAKQDRLRAELERLARLDWDISPALQQAVQAVLTALDYDDPALLRSQLNAAFEASRDLVHDAIQKRLGRPQLVRESWRNIWEVFQGCAVESYDEVGRELAALFKTQLDSLISLRDGPIRTLQERGYKVENASQLKCEIEELQKLKEGIFENWPWTTQTLPPVNRKMVAESRAAIARGEGERIEDLLRRLGGEPTRDG